MLIAVTGSGGQLGSELVRQLGSTAFPLDLPEFDLTDRRAVERTLLGLQPAAVVNTAAFTDVDRAEREAEHCRRVNADGVANLAEACRQIDCALLQISTDYVFGAESPRQLPYLETDLPGPVSVYGQSKLDGECAALGWHKSIVVRTCGLYGLAGRLTATPNFVEKILERAQRAEPLRVVADQHCAPSFVPHVAAALRSLMERQAYGIFHVTDAGETTWYEFAREILRQSRLDTSVVPIASDESRGGARRPGYSVLDCGKYRSLGGSPLPDWRESLAEYLRLTGRSP